MRLDKAARTSCAFSDVAAYGLRFLSRICQQSVVSSLYDRGRQQPAAPVFLVALSMLAYDAAEGVTAGSSREVRWLPIAPIELNVPELQLRAAAKKHNIRVPSPAMTAGRHTLWLAHGNARELHLKLRELETESNWVAIRDAALHPMRFDTGAADFIANCEAKSPPISPVELLQSLFWAFPTKSSPPTAANHMMKAAFVAEAHGLCNIIRHDDCDTVYMHPKYASAICDNLLRSGNEALFLGSVQASRRARSSGVRQAL